MCDFSWLENLHVHIMHTASCCMQNQDFKGYCLVFYTWLLILELVEIHLNNK